MNLAQSSESRPAISKVYFQMAGVDAYAYVLMTNHVQLMFTGRKAGDVPRLILTPGRRYVQYLNFFLLQ